MRVRPLRPTDRRARTERRPHGPGRPEEAPEAPEATMEERHRECVMPEDTAHYGCSCGFQFQAAVSTSVRCPHCGTAQAW